MPSNQLLPFLLLHLQVCKLQPFTITVSPQPAFFRTEVKIATIIDLSEENGTKMLQLLESKLFPIFNPRLQTQLLRSRTKSSAGINPQQFMEYTISGTVAVSSSARIVSQIITVCLGGFNANLMCNHKESCAVLRLTRKRSMVLSQSLANIVAIANLMPYLMDVMEEKLPKAAATAIIRIGITAIMAIGGSYLSDACIGRYHTILGSTAIYVTGLFLLAVAASPTHSSKHIVTYQTGLFLIACGKAGHSPMLKDFGADQLTSNREEDNDYEIKKRVAVWWCMGATLGAFLGIILLVVAEGNQHWNLVYALLAVTMTLATWMFISGRPFYRHVEPCGSVLSRVSHVFVAAFLNRHLEFPLNVSQFNHGSGNELLPHTDGLRFLDKAAIKESLSDDPNEHENKWKHRTVTEVEETKLLIRMLPMWTTFLLFGLVSSLGSTLFLQQGINMNRKLHHFKVPLPMFILFTRYVSGQITWINMRLSKKFPTSKQVMNPTRRIGIGMLFGVFCCSVASWVEAKRLNIIKQYSLQNKPKDTLPISVFWLMPQFLLLGAMDGFTYPGIKDFFYGQVPKSMRNFGPSFTASMIGVGSLLSVIVIAAIDRITSQGGRPSWFADSTNKSRLDYYYQTLTVLSYINLIFYAFVASKYTYTTPETENESNVSIGDTMSF